MEHFTYLNEELFAEKVALSAIAASYGTPSFVYSRASIEQQFGLYKKALAGSSHLVCYAVKANSNLAVLKVLAKLGSGFDIVSSGELQRVLRAGGDPGKIIFSGVGKSEAEIGEALVAGILCFNIESEQELERIDRIAKKMDRQAPVSLRVNPDVDAGTHPYISTGLKENKFGIDIEQAFLVYQRAASMANIAVIGIDCHIGSQLIDMSPLMDAVERLLALLDRLKVTGINIKHFDIGGGLGVTYREEQPPLPDSFIRTVLDKIAGRGLTLLLEPGRSIVGNAGVFLTRVEYIKHTEHKNFVIIDGAMNDLIRPALYNAWQNIVPVKLRNNGTSEVYDVVGPVCESADFLGKDRPLVVAQGDLLAILGAGAYGFVMSSNYNSRNRAAEIMVDGTQAHLVRKRETLDDQLKLEHCLPE